ncbi:aminotransferase class IV [candidate division KSB1 bacterium]|nr:aminotransferase class IV [candidate division KSB1 bacterium]
MENIVYLNGEFLPLEDAHISPFDRGFNFGDGAYEVIRSYAGKFFRMDDHLNRLLYSLHELMIPPVDITSVSHLITQLLEKNKLAMSDALVYMQVTRGVFPRSHQLPSQEIRPTVFMSVSQFQPQHDLQETGVKVILFPDIRWTRCDIKTISLLPNMMARNKATSEGAIEALFVRDDIILEGTRSNFCAIYRDQLITAPTSRFTLAGVTRKVVLELCKSVGIPTYENPIYANQLRHFHEMMILSTSLEVTPVVQVDNTIIGDGKAGEITRRLQDAFHKLVEKLQVQAELS